MASLNGRAVAFVEARMTSEMAGLIERHGGVPYAAPVLQEVYLKDSPEVQQLVLDVCAGQIDAVTLLTGVGTQALVSTAAGMGREKEFINALDRLTVIARSPKPARVLRRHKIHIDVMPPEPYTTADLIDSLDAWDLAGKVVALQHYGGPNRPLAQHLQDKGAQVREITLYTWGLPEDETPVINMIDHLTAGKIDAIAFTSQPQVGNLLAIADKADKETALRASLGAGNKPSDGTSGRGVVVASVGPVCTRRLLEAGIPVDVEPEHPHMGSMVLALAEHFG